MKAKINISNLFARAPLALSIFAVVSLVTSAVFTGAVPDFRSSVRISYLSSFAQSVSNAPLFVRTSRSLVQPGEAYYLYAVQPRGNAIESYTGPLDYQLNLCVGPTFSQCSFSTGRWLDMNAGMTIAPLPANMQVGVYRAKFRPSGSSQSWSNEIQVNVGTNSGLENVSNYWLMPTNNEAVFVGRNNLTGESFTTRVGYKKSQLPCLPSGSGAVVMYMAKSATAGYWAPGSASNLFWYLTPWQNKGYHDTYLSAEGHEAYATNLNSLAYGDNFKEVQSSYKYGPTEKDFPPYVLAPEWIGAGWGIGTSQTYAPPAGSNQSLCASRAANVGSGFWAVHGDFVDLNLPRYNGPALVLSYWEFFGQDAFVERWYFVKNVGLVKIQANTYGTSTGKLCDQDPDCFVNKIMQNPQVEMTLADYVSPAPVPTPLPTTPQRRKVR